MGAQDTALGEDTLWGPSGSWWGEGEHSYDQPTGEGSELSQQVEDENWAKLP